jgi:hypothetical protein
MSHDLRLTIEKNKCDCCKRTDVEELAQYNISYNHCWIWYQDYDKENGFKAIYGVPIVELIPKIEKLKAQLIFLNGAVPVHEPNPQNKKIRTIDDKLVEDDGWAKTNYNAYRCILEILEICNKYVQEYPTATWGY